ncbi:hypothetical protein HOK68_04045 [Candidatus Woesearchaeota archaeon]|jgi:hypothetical protein|nr:hypothetical protein [Candidatus Woesearchaeota archaeon]MBT4595481.1 hypothetical protein [Candidatus Woesearchaeota archaeon]MBT5740667.1 hypothetical protein [Candidatus Woesearchaeota archaeon]MBT6505921.1 hypothetical protein [Candidatus Woesearchaeota archaeon]MBT7297074.1 hypothetical protein [Candidatus Woesearchaeota archaeon]
MNKKIVYLIIFILIFNYPSIFAKPIQSSSYEPLRTIDFRTRDFSLTNPEKSGIFGIILVGENGQYFEFEKKYSTNMDENTDEDSYLKNLNTKALPKIIRDKTEREIAEANNAVKLNEYYPYFNDKFYFYTKPYYFYNDVDGKNEVIELENGGANYFSKSQISQGINVFNSEYGRITYDYFNSIKPDFSSRAPKFQSISGLLDNSNIENFEFDKRYNPNNIKLLKDTPKVYVANTNIFCENKNFNIDFYDEKFCTNKKQNGGCQPNDETWVYQDNFCCGNSKINVNGLTYIADAGLPRISGGIIMDPVCIYEEVAGKKAFGFKRMTYNEIFQFKGGNFEHSVIQSNDFNRNIKFNFCKTKKAYELDQKLEPTGENWNKYETNEQINQNTNIVIINKQYDEEKEEIICKDNSYTTARYLRCLDEFDNDLNLKPHAGGDENNLKQGESIYKETWNLDDSDYIDVKDNTAISLKENNFIDSKNITLSFDFIGDEIGAPQLEIEAYSYEFENQNIDPIIIQIKPEKYYPNKKTKINQFIEIENFTKFHIECTSPEAKELCKIKNIRVYTDKEFNKIKNICSNNRSFISINNLKNLDQDESLSTSQTICEKSSDHNKYIINGSNELGTYRTCCIPDKNDYFLGKNGACISGNYIDNENYNNINNDNVFTSTGFLLVYKEIDGSEKTKFISNIYANSNYKIEKTPLNNITRVHIENLDELYYNISKNENNEIIELKNYYPNIIYSDKVYTCGIDNSHFNSAFKSIYDEKLKTNINKLSLFPELTEDGSKLDYPDNNYCKNIGEFFCNIDGTFKIADTSLLQFHNFTNDKSYIYPDNISELVTTPTEISGLTKDSEINLETDKQNLACCPGNSCYDGNECIENQAQFPSVDFEYSNYINLEKGQKYKRETNKNGMPYKFDSIEKPKICAGKFLEKKYEVDEVADGWIDYEEIVDWTGNYKGSCMPKQCLTPIFLLDKQSKDYIKESSENQLINFRSTLQDKQFVCVDHGFFTKDHICSYKNETETKGVWSTRTSVIIKELAKKVNKTIEESPDKYNYMIHCDNTSNILINNIDLDHGSVCILRISTEPINELVGINDENVEFTWATTINNPNNISNFENWINKLDLEPGSTCIEKYKNIDETKTKCGVYKNNDISFNVILDNKYKTIYFEETELSTIEQIDLFILDDFVKTLINFFSFEETEIIETLQKAPSFSINKYFKSETKNAGEDKKNIEIYSYDLIEMAIESGKYKSDTGIKSMKIKMNNLKSAESLKYKIKKKVEEKGLITSSGIQRWKKFESDQIEGCVKDNIEYLESNKLIKCKYIWKVFEEDSDAYEPRPTSYSVAIEGSTYTDDTKEYIKNKENTLCETKEEIFISEKLPLWKTKTSFAYGTMNFKCTSKWEFKNIEKGELCPLTEDIYNNLICKKGELKWQVIQKRDFEVKPFVEDGVTYIMAKRDNTIEFIDVSIDDLKNSDQYSSDLKHYISNSIKNCQNKNEIKIKEYADSDNKGKLTDIKFECKEELLWEETTTKNIDLNNIEGSYCMSNQLNINLFYDDTQYVCTGEDVPGELEIFASNIATVHDWNNKENLFSNLFNEIIDGIRIK